MSVSGTAGGKLVDGSVGVLVRNARTARPLGLRRVTGGSSLDSPLVSAVVDGREGPPSDAVCNNRGVGEGIRGCDGVGGGGEM